MDVKGIEWEGIDWINLAQDADTVNTVTDLSCAKFRWVFFFFFDRLRTISVLRRTLVTLS
jgi:hypothetical protein